MTLGPSDGSRPTGFRWFRRDRSRSTACAATLHPRLLAGLAVMRPRRIRREYGAVLSSLHNSSSVFVFGMTDTKPTSFSSSAKTDADWRAELTPSSTASFARRAPSVPSAASCGTSTDPASTAVPAAAPNSSTPRPSSSPAPAGRASSPRPIPWRSRPRRTSAGSDPDRGAVRHLRRAPGARLRRRPEPDRPPLLHQFGGAQARPEGVALAAAARPCRPSGSEVPRE